ncbi:MAG: TIGR02678 family protein [Chloroflexi bacterium]|nr:MAG: TIGR02678 family protein [Chloroflexota bacterium]
MEEYEELAAAGRASRLSMSRQRTYTAEITKAHVALMERGVILSKQIDLFRLVNRHYYTLQNWHDQNTGWRIQRGATVIRLVRQLSATTPGYVYDRLKEPRDFACLTWILSFAENRQLTGRGNEQQFLLSQLAEHIQEQSRSETDGETAFDFRRPTDRYSIQRALQYLEDMGGVQLIDGQTKEWVEQSADADVLYEFTDVIRSLVSAFNPQLLAMVATHLNNEGKTLQPTLLQSIVGDNFPVMALKPLVRAWRTLLLGPVLLRYDDPEAFAELVAHSDEVANELLETFGWLLDVKRDYACVVRASGMSSGPVTSLTPFGTSDQMAVLMCTAIREQVTTGAWPLPDKYGCVHVTSEDMNALFYTLRERYGENWGNEARSKGSRSLLNDVYKKMRQAGLLRGPDGAGNMLILPTAARYSASYEKAGQEQKPAGKNKSKSIAITLPGLDESE